MLTDRALTRAATPLVGRDRERGFLRDSLSVARQGHGRLVLIGGEAGIGKTALAAALCRDAASSGAAVLIGRCYDLSETPPYGPWVEIFHQLAAEPDATPAPFPLGVGDAVPDRPTLFSRLLDTLTARAARQPLLVVLDDLHWADQSSLDLLRHLARQLDARPVLVLATYRPDELTRAHPLYQLLPTLVREADALRLALRPLELGSVAALVRAHYSLTPPDAERLVAYLDRRAEGNPFFIGELLRALEEGGLLRAPDGPFAPWALGDLARARLPSLVRQVIDGRAARLGEQARDQLAVAAVLGQAVPLDLWAALVGTRDDALLPATEAALDARLVEADDGANIRFVHALVREALYEGIPPTRRRALHQRAGELLAARHDPDPDAVAYHFQQAGAPQAVTWLIKAGQRARTLYSPQRAATHFSRALELARRFEVAPPPELYRERGLAYEILGDFERAQADQGAALALARAAGDRIAEWQALIDLGQLWAGRDYTRAEDHYGHALALARELADPATLAHSLNWVGNWHVNGDQPFTGQAYHREALAIFRQLGDRRGVAATIDQLGMARFLGGDLIEAAAHGREAAALFRQLDDRHALASTLAWLGDCGGWYGGELSLPAFPLAEGQSYAEEGARLARAIGWRAGEAFALLMLAASRGQQGEFGEALALGQQGLALAEEIAHGEWQTEAHFRLGAIHADLLATAAARRHLDRALALARALNSRCLERLISGALASHCVGLGELTRARSLLDAAMLGPDDPPFTAGQRRCRLALAELVLAEGDPASALLLLDSLAPPAADGAASGTIDHLWRARARTLAALGRLTEAIATLDAARRVAAGRGARALLWRLHADAAAFHHAAGDPDAARAAASEARALIAELAAPMPDAELREQFLSGASALLASFPTEPDIPSRLARGYPAGLTAREAEVLRLVAQGLTNPQIGDQLSISGKTVARHLESVYAKLDVRTRAAAARIAAEHGLA